jgi:hypothetical protein
MVGDGQFAMYAVLRLWMWVDCGVEVVSVCWRHMTMPDGTWVCFLRASGVDVRMLGGARGGAPAPWGRFFCNLSDS